MLRNFISNFVVLGMVVVTGLAAQGRASTDPYESDGLKHLFSSFGGIWLLDFDKSSKLINQTESGDSIVVDDYRNGFRYLQNVNAALGIEVPLNYALPAGVTVGLDLMSGVNSSFDRFAESRDAIPHMGFPYLPRHAGDLASWTPGDSVLFQARGGVGFAIGIGFTHFMGAATYAFAEGDWVVYVEKLQHNHAYVKITNTHCGSIGILANSIVVGVEAARFKEIDHAFSFDYDLNNDNARLAYEDALHGSLGPSDNLARQKDSSVVRVLTLNEASVGSLRSWYYGIPLLAIRGGKIGQIFAYDDIFNNADGSQSAVHTGAYLDHHYSAGLVSNHMRQINDFYATAVDGTAHGEYLWAFESGAVSEKLLSGEISNLIAHTGLTSLRTIALPTYRYLGYLNIKFSAELSQQTVGALLDWVHASSDTMTYLLERSGQTSIENTFAKTSADTTALCNSDRSQDRAACKAAFLVQTGFATQQMVVELQAMDRSREQNNPKAFAAHLAAFGKQMATNQFTFQNVLQLTTAAPMDMTLSMEGERISKFKKSIAAQVSAL